MQKVNDPAVRHTSSGALIRRFLPYLAKYKKTLFIDLFCAAMTTLCDIILPKIMSTITNSAMGVGITLTAGICGRPFCCKTFLGDFQPVSIKMAKEQGLSLNPVKISGNGRPVHCRHTR